MRVRLDFMIITQLIEVPDHTTFCLSYNLLPRLNLWDDLLAEVKEFKAIIQNHHDKRMCGNKVYASEANKELLKAKGIKNGIRAKAKKNKPLTP